MELVIAGAGPSGLAVAARVSQAGFKVCVVDPNPRAPWPNNYGVWVDEFEAMGLTDYLEVVWPKANVFLDSSENGEKFLYRPYGRVDRPRLKRDLLKQCVQQGVVFHQARAEDVEHGEDTSLLRCGEAEPVRARMVLDATGHARKLVKFDQPFNPGYQGAYGIMAEVESHPFDMDTMLFMDWRDDHTAGNPDMHESNRRLPTFLYAMPFSKTKIFLEETSLVARPAVGFQDLKDRLEARMAHLGIRITAIEEEEYCLIPMGGVLPRCPQRTLGIGGTAGMVHPSTGYMVARTLGSVPVVADTVIEQLCAVSSPAANSELPLGPRTQDEGERLSAVVWHALWPVERIRQREFFNFGMDVLLKLDLQETRQFFTAFFSLSDYHWHGFLSARLSFAELIAFGWSLFVNSSTEARLSLLGKGLPGLVVMLGQLAGTINYKPKGLEASPALADRP